MKATGTQSLFLVGCNHETAPLEVRERFAIQKERQGDLYRELKGVKGMEECLILNTCNRVEVYGVGADEEVKERMMERFYDVHELKEKDFKPHQYILKDEAVMKHLFEVASGLNSQMVGETEILGQVKSSYEVAKEHEAAGKIMHKAMQKSFQAAKWIRTNTSIGVGQVSVGSVTGDLATRMFGELGETRILIIGSGEVAEATMHSLAHKGATDVVVTNRTYEKAHILAEKFGGMAIDFENFGNQLHHFDIVIASTSSREVILTEEMLKKALNERGPKPLFLVDLAVPRDVCANAGKLGNAYLYNIDDLARIANENLNARMGEVEKCREILREKAVFTWEGLFS